MRFLPQTLALSLLLVGCASWAPVQYTPQPVTINDPVADVKGLLTLRAMPTMFGTRPMPALLVEVTEQYVKEVYASGGLLLLNFQQAASFKILHKEDVYQVSAYNGAGDEIWMYRPSTKDLATCQKMMNALFALSKRAPSLTGAQASRD